MNLLPYKISSSFIFTLATNYAFILAIFVGVDFILKNFGGLTSFLGVILATSWGNLLLWLKERFMFFVYGTQIAKCKRDYSMSFSDWRYVVQTQLVYTFVAVLSSRQGLYYWDSLDFSPMYYFRTVGTFYVLQFLKDVVALKYLHKWMHESKTLYAYHKEHHTVNKNAQNMMASHIDVIDLFLENLCAPALMLLILHFSGRKATMSFGAMLLSTIMDIEIHAINPHTPCLFNPIMDYYFRCNIAHQIHHARQTENYMFIPYHHRSSKVVKTEMRRYDEIMGTTFFETELTDFGKKA